MLDIIYDIILFIITWTLRIGLALAMIAFVGWFFAAMVSACKDDCCDESAYKFMKRMMSRSRRKPY